MRNIPINEAETIFEAFWEIPVKQAGYDRLNPYHKEDRGIATISTQSWAARIDIRAGQKDTDLPVVVERDCVLKIDGYDRMKLFANVDKTMHFRMVCCIDGVDTEVYDFVGNGPRQEYIAEISGSMITHLRMEFHDISEKGAVASLVWIGLANSAREHEMLTRESPYTEDWYGYFSEEPDIKPQLGLFFGEEELAEIRDKIKQPGFDRWMERIRKSAEAKMSIVPENEVGKFVNKPDARFSRDRDKQRPVLVGAMTELAFVGLVDQNLEMLRMACRMAMAICHCQYFYASDMGVYPGVTFHHECFDEMYICDNLVRVLDWAGGYLNERGRKLVYRSIQRKGLPEIDLVLKVTYEGNKCCNRGTIYGAILSIVLTALTQKYPRYEIRREEAEREFFEMWSNYVFEDGGSGEGGSYWSYTMGHCIDAVRVLARAHGKKLEEYIPEIVVKSGKYASSMLSEVNNTFLPINDCGFGGRFPLKIVQFLAQINAGDTWRVLNNEMIDNGYGDIDCLIHGCRYDVSAKPEVPELIHMEATGVTAVKRKTDDLGTVAFYAISGLGVDGGHGHTDKGSFILEADHTALLIDRGSCGYGDTFHAVIVSSQAHNVLAAVDNGVFLNQGRSKRSFCGNILKTEYENGVFSYATDSAPAWNGAFERNIRKIDSPNPYLYIIEDDAKPSMGDSVCFVLNTYGEISQEGDAYIIIQDNKKLIIRTRDWKPEKVLMGEFGINGKGTPVNRLCLFIGGQEEYHLTTEIKLEKI